MAQQINLKPIWNNGTISFVPDYQISQYQPATSDEVNSEIAKYSPGGDRYSADPNWANTYVQGLKQNLQTMQSGDSPYALGSSGELTTKKALGEQEQQQIDIASGKSRNIGTENAPLTIDKGTAGDIAMQNPQTLGDVLGGQGRNVYSVKRGDTLSSIAAKSGVSLQDLISANPQIKNHNLIFPGQGINIPPPKSQQEENPPDTEGPANEAQDKTYQGLQEKSPGGLMPTDITDIQKMLKDIENTIKTSSNNPISLMPTGSDLPQGVDTSQFTDIINTLKTAISNYPAPKDEKAYFEQLMTTPDPTIPSYTDPITGQKIPNTIQGLQQEAIDYNNLMNGTEDQVRSEIAKAGGIATEAQIQGIVAEKNRILQIKANGINDMLNAKVAYANQLVGFDQQYAKDKVQQFNDITGLTDKIATLEQTYETNQLKIRDQQQNLQWRQTYQASLLQDRQQTMALTMFENLAKGGGMANMNDADLQIIADRIGGGVTVDELRKVGNAEYAAQQAATNLKGAQAQKIDITIAGGTGGITPPGFDVATWSQSITNKNTPLKEAGGLTLDALVNDAKMFLYMGGKVPSLGLGQATDVKAARIMIQNYAGYLADQLHTDLPTLTSLYKANSAVLGKQIDYVVNVQRSLNAAEEGGQKVIDSFKGTGIDPSSSPLANKWLSDFQSTLTGGKIFAFQGALQEVRNEYQNVFSRNGSQGVTEGVREMSDRIIKGNISFNDLQSLFSSLQDQGSIVLSTAQNTVNNLANNIGTLGNDPLKVGGSNANDPLGINP